MLNYLFSGRPSKVLPWSWLKSLGLGLGTRILGLGLGLEVQSLGIGLDKKVLFTSMILRYLIYPLAIFNEVIMPIVNAMML